MIVLLDTSQDLAECEAEIGVPVEQLLTPLTRYLLQRPDEKFGIDNGAYSKFNRAGFERLLEKYKPKSDQCRFVALPDVVASARRTLEAFRYWLPKTEGWKRALVAQDGIEDLDIPWEHLDAVFIGGSTDFKMSHAVLDVIKTAKICDKWVHVGRVNTPGRFEYFDEHGADSIDGTGLSRYSWMRRAIYAKVNEPPGLFDEGEGENL